MSSTKREKMVKSDEELLREIAKQNKNAYTEFYNQYVKAFYRFVLGKVKNQDMADDILQDFWLKLWDDPSFIKCDEQGSAKNYIFQHLRFRIFDLFRNTVKTHISLEEVDVEKEMEWYYTISSDMEVDDILLLIKEVIADLPPLTKETFWMRIADYSVEETSEKLSISTQSVYNKYSQSLAVIRKHLEENHPELAEGFSGIKSKKALSLKNILLFIILFRI